MIKWICFLCTLFLGLMMTIAPKQSLKKELRDSEEAIKKIRIFGFFGLGFSFLMLIFILLI